MSSEPREVKVSRAVVILAVGYGLWVLYGVVITVFNIGDAGVVAHMGLLFTGLPAALFSLVLPHGSLPGVLAAGVLGLLQWTFLANWASRALARRKADRMDLGERTEGPGL